MSKITTLAELAQEAEAFATTCEKHAELLRNSREELNAIRETGERTLAALEERKAAGKETEVCVGDYCVDISEGEPCIEIAKGKTEEKVIAWLKENGYDTTCVSCTPRLNMNALKTLRVNNPDAFRKAGLTTVTTNWLRVTKHGKTMKVYGK